VPAPLAMHLPQLQAYIFGHATAPSHGQPAS
jgi:hypothetical protein